MASPRTRRVLAELRPKDGNNVSFVTSETFTLICGCSVLNVSKYSNMIIEIALVTRNASSVALTILNGRPSPMGFGFASSAVGNTGGWGFTSPLSGWFANLDQEWAEKLTVEGNVFV